MSTSIRRARSDDLPALCDLERAANALYWELGMDEVADDELPAVADLAVFQEDGRAWVVADAADEPIAYLLVESIDGNAHIAQVSVHPSHARRRLGRALIDVAAAWADRRGLAALTLTTYADVPWNAPYYERLGFRILPDDEIGCGLRRIREYETASGLAAWPRVTMRRSVGRRVSRRP
ncbi:MAG: GNAT family N-acetyltransferase [Solirubrobacteraceae bacterium]